MAETKRGREGPWAGHLPEDTREHLKSARDEFRKSVEGMLPPEFLEHRFNATARTFLAIMAILGALFIHIGMSMYAGAQVFEQFFDDFCQFWGLKISGFPSQMG